MNKPSYDEAIKVVDIIYNTTNLTKEQLQPLIDYLNASDDYITQSEQRDRDVARYFELLESNVSYVFLGTQDICDEFDELEEKLSKGIEKWNETK